jgi:ribosomal protein L44E
LRKSMPPQTSPTSRRIFCNKCKRDTNHDLRGSYEHRHEIETEQWDGWWGELCHLYACAGCESPTLMVIFEWSEDEPETTFWPPRTEDSHEAKQFHKLPAPLGKIYEESVEALNSGSMVLCTLGLRTLIEGVCNDKRLKGYNLQEKIDGLRKFLPSGNIVKYLHGFRFSGNQAAHKLTALTKQEARRALEVMDDLLMTLYDLDYKASLLKHANRRVRRKKASLSKKPAPPPPQVP